MACRCPPEALFQALVEDTVPRIDWHTVHEHVHGCERCRATLLRVRCEVDHGRRWHHTWRRLGLSCPDDTLLRRWLWNQPGLRAWERTRLLGHLEVSRCGICRERLSRTRARSAEPCPLVDLTDTMLVRTRIRDESESRKRTAIREADLEAAFRDVRAAWGEWARRQPEKVWLHEFESFRSSIRHPGQSGILLGFLETAGVLMRRGTGDREANSWLALATELEIDVLLRGEWIRDRVAGGIRFELGWRAGGDVRIAREVAIGQQVARERILEHLRRRAGEHPCLVAMLWHEAFLAGRRSGRIDDGLGNLADLARRLIAVDTRGGRVSRTVEQRAIRRVRRIANVAAKGTEPYAILEECRDEVRRTLDADRAGDALVLDWAAHVHGQLGVPSERIRTTPGEPAHYALRLTRPPSQEVLLGLVVLDVDVHRNFRKLGELVGAIASVLPLESRPMLDERFVERIRRRYGPKRYLAFRNRTRGEGPD